jgi:glutaredoxin 3
MVIIYGNQVCSFCLRAKALATRYNLPFEWRDTDDSEILNELKLKLPNAKTIPQIWWHDKYIGGYEDFATEVQNTLGGFGESSF